ncbi:hypothetical protein M569_17007, partial [Genlisea aurea]
DVDTVFRILTSSNKDPHSLRLSLRQTLIPLSNELIDGVLKRVRFSHSDPISALALYNFTSRKKNFSHTPYSLDTMLYILGRNRRFDDIWELLAETKRRNIHHREQLITPRTIQIVVARIAKVSSVSQTVSSFNKFKKLVPELDVSCYNALLRAVSQEKSMADARRVYRDTKREFRPNLQTFNILLSGWKSAVDAEAFLAEMKDVGIDPDVVTYNCLVDVHCKGRDVGRAYGIVEEMREGGIEPDVVTYTSLIGGLGLVGQPDKARGVLEEMKEYGCRPDAAAYNAAIRNFCIARRLKEAYALVAEMEGDGTGPNATTYNVILRSLYWANDLCGSWELYRRMRATGCLPNTQSCMFLIRLMRRQEKASLAVELWEDMVELGFGSYTLVSDVLIGLLCDLGMVDDAERCFLQMVDKGQRPSRVSFRRIKVLMELSGRFEALSNLREKMASF